MPLIFPAPVFRFWVLDRSPALKFVLKVPSTSEMLSRSDLRILGSVSVTTASTEMESEIPWFRAVFRASLVASKSTPSPISSSVMTKAPFSLEMDASLASRT